MDTNVAFTLNVVDLKPMSATRGNRGLERILKLAEMAKSRPDLCKAEWDGKDLEITLYAAGLNALVNVFTVPQAVEEDDCEACKL